MSYSHNNYLITILMITFYLLNIPPIAFPIDDSEPPPIDDTDPLDYKCLSYSNKTFNSIYNQTLESVVKHLINNTPNVDSGVGGYSGSIKSGDDGWVYGHALCRGDVSVGDCQVCIEKAANTLINTNCPNNRSAIIWYDYCMLKYSDDHFFGKIDTSINITKYNNENSYFEARLVDDFFKNLSEAAKKSPAMFAHASIVSNDPGDITTHMYGMVQCTGDFLYQPDDCGTCLNLAIKGLSECCDIKLSARIVYPSCNLRFEMYDFLKS